MSEDGEAVEGLIPKIQEAFDKYTQGTVSIIDKQNGGLNSTYEILEQLSKVYPTLTDEAKAYINEVVAGNRQNKVLVAILENWQNVETAVESAKNSTGSALKENEKYLNSINGKMAQFKSSTQQLWQNLISSDAIKFFVDLGTVVIKTLDTGFVRFIATIALTTTAFGLLGKAITALKATTLAYTIQQNLLMISTNGLKTTIQSLWVTMSASPLFWVAAATAAVIGLVKVFDALNVSVEEQRQKVDELNKGYNELKDKIKSLRAVQNPTKEQIEYIGLLERELELQGEILKIQQKRLMEKEVYGSGRLAKEVEKNLQTIDEYTEGMKYAQSELQRVLSTYTEEELLKYSDDDTWIEHIEDLKDQTKELELELIKQKTTIDDYIKTLGNEAPQKLKDLSKSIEDALPKIQALNGGIKNTDTTTEKYIPTLEELTKAYEEATDAIDNYQSSAKQLSDIYDTINEDGKVSADTLIDLIQKYPQLASEIVNINSTKEFGLELTQKLFEIEKQKAIAELQSNKEILDSKIALLEADKKDLELQKNRTKTIQDYYLSNSNLDDSTKELLRKRYNVQLEEIQKAIDEFSYGNLKDQSNSIAEAIELITGLKVPDLIDKKSSSTFPIPYESLTQELIRSYNAEVERDKIAAKLLEKQITQAKRAEDYNKAIERTNALLTNQQKTVDDLKTANDKIHTEANRLRANTKYDTSTWFDVNGEATLAYKELLNSFAGKTDEASKKEKEAIEELFKNLYDLKKAWGDNSDAIEQYTESMYQSQQQINELINTQEELRVKEIKESYNKELSALKDNHELGIISTEQYYQSLKDLYTKYKDFLSGNDTDALSSLQKDIQSSYQKLYDEELKELKHNHDLKTISTKQYFKSLMQLAEKYSEFLKSTNKDAWNSLIQEIQKTDELISKQYEDLQKSVIDILKKRYDQEEKLRKQQHDSIMQQLDDEKKAYQEYINSRIEDLDRLNAKEDYEDNVAEQSKVINDLQKEIDKYSLASATGDMEATVKVADLKKQLIEEEKRLTETQTKRERDLRKQNLQDNLKDFENYIDEKKRKEEDAFDEYKRNLEKATQDTALQIEAQNILMQNSIQGAQSALLELFNTTGINASKTGKLLQDEIIDKLLQIRDLEKQVKSVSNISGVGYNKISAQPYANGGISTNTHLAILHGTPSKPEWILNTEQMKKLVNGLAFGGFTPKFNTPDLTNVAKNEIHIDSLITVEGNVTKETIPAIKSAGNNIINQLKGRGWTLQNA